LTAGARAVQGKSAAEPHGSVGAETDSARRNGLRALVQPHRRGGGGAPTRAPALTHANDVPFLSIRQPPSLEWFSRGARLDALEVRIELGLIGRRERVANVVPLRLRERLALGLEVRANRA